MTNFRFQYETLLLAHTRPKRQLDGILGSLGRNLPNWSTASGIPCNQSMNYEDGASHVDTTMTLDSFQLINSNEWQALKRALAIYSKEYPQQLKTLTHPKLAFLFKDEDKKESGQKGSDKGKPHFDFQSRAAFILSTAPTNAQDPRAICVVDVGRSKAECETLEAKSTKFINESGVDHLIYLSQGNEVSEYKHHRTHATSQHSNRKRFNYAQYNCAMSFYVDRQIGQDVITIHHEISLDRILEVSNIPIDDLKDQLESREGVGKNFLKNTDVDALLCLGVDDATIPGYLNSIPLFGIEYDGPTHNDKRQNQDDAKTAVFRAAGIPLIRVNSKNFNIRRKDKNTDYRYFEKINRALSELLINQIVKSPAYAKRLIRLAQKDISESNSKDPVVSRLDSLIQRLDHQLEFRINAASKLEKDNERLTDFYDWHEGDHYGYDDKKQVAWEAEQHAIETFGLPVTIVQRASDDVDGVTITAEIGNPHYHSVAPDLRKSMSIGPYNVYDATGLVDLSEHLVYWMEVMLKRKISAYLSSGGIPVIDRVKKQLYIHLLDTSSINEIVANVMGPPSTYWKLLAFELYQLNYNTYRVCPKSTSEYLESLKADFVKPDYDSRANLLLKELEALHTVLSASDIKMKLERAIFESTDSSLLATTSTHSTTTITENLKRIRRYLSKHRLVDLINNPEKLREVWFSNDL